MSPRVSAKAKASPVPETYPERTLVVCKDSELAGAAPRMRYAETVLYTLAEFSGGSVGVGRHVYVLRAPVPVGDPRWALDNVFMRYDLYNVTSTAAARRLARDIADYAATLPDARAMFGTAVTGTMLDRVFARYDDLEDISYDNGITEE